MKHSRIVSLLGCIGLYVMASAPAVAYTTNEGWRPKDLTITLVLNTTPLHDNFTRYLTFTNRAGNMKAVDLTFEKQPTNLNYLGKVTTSGLATLQSLAEPNNRSYWDSMKFENKGGTTALDINQLFAVIEYPYAKDRKSTTQIAYIVNQHLAAGNDSFALPGIGGSGRINDAMDYLHISYAELMSYPAPLLYFIFDLGKSGSSDATDSVSSKNPKYGLADTSLCAETISWYYSDNHVVINDQDPPYTKHNFRNITFHGTMHDQFLSAGRLYCYAADQQEWVKKNLDYTDSSQTYVPQPGDYLDRRDSPGVIPNDGHGMMLAAWDDLSGNATVLDGPANINFRVVHVDTDVANGKDYCVGRIPANDPFVAVPHRY